MPDWEASRGHFCRKKDFTLVRRRQPILIINQRAVKWSECPRSKPALYCSTMWEGPSSFALGTHFLHLAFLQRTCTRKDTLVSVEKVVAPCCCLPNASIILSWQTLWSKQRPWPGLPLVSTLHKTDYVTTTSGYEYFRLFSAIGSSQKTKQGGENWPTQWQSLRVPLLSSALRLLLLPILKNMYQLTQITTLAQCISG